MSNNFQKVRVVKLFASSEYKIRNRAYKTIKYLLKLEFGNDKKQLSETDILAIWKGLYVWLWMQDKPLLHEEVVEKISSLLPTILSEKLALEFIKGFFITMNREWPKIDNHRLDKYYMLVREMLNSSLNWLQSKEWRHLDEWLEILQGIVLTPSLSGAVGLKLHFADIILDELIKIDAGSPVVTRMITEIILSLAGVNYQNVYFSKIIKRVVDRILPLHKQKLNIDLLQVSQSLLNAAAKKEMKSKTRKIFYKLADRFKSVPNDLVADCGAAEIVGEAMETNDGEAAVDVVEQDGRIEQAEEEERASQPCVDPSEPAGNVEPDANEAGLADVDMGESETATREPSESAQRKSPRKPAANNKPKKAQPAARKSSNECESDRRVTFGKRYTKKFTRTTTTIGVSQGTVKQHEIKSILKRKSA